MGDAAFRRAAGPSPFSRFVARCATSWHTAARTCTDQRPGSGHAASQMAAPPRGTARPMLPSTDSGIGNCAVAGSETPIRESISPLVITASHSLAMTLLSSRVGFSRAAPVRHMPPSAQAHRRQWSCRPVQCLIRQSCLWIPGVYRVLGDTRRTAPFCIGLRWLSPQWVLPSSSRLSRLHRNTYRFPVECPLVSVCSDMLDKLAEQLFVNAVANDVLVWPSERIGFSKLPLLLDHKSLEACGEFHPLIPVPRSPSPSAAETEVPRRFP